MSNEPVLRIEFDKHVLTLNLDECNWGVDKEDELGKLLVDYANHLTRMYEYSPADGYPGYRLTSEIAKAMNGKAILPPPPPIDPNVVY